jgi:hypothetical protein
MFYDGLVDILILKGTLSCCKIQKLLCLNDFDIIFFYVLVAFLKKVGVNKNGANKIWYSHQNQDVSVIKRSQSKDTKAKMRERKLKKKRFNPYPANVENARKWQMGLNSAFKGLNQQGIFDQKNVK